MAVLPMLGCKELCPFRKGAVKAGQVSPLVQDGRYFPVIQNHPRSEEGVSHRHALYQVKMTPIDKDVQGVC